MLGNQLNDGYLTADLSNPKAMVKMDITDIQYPDESFDVIYCSHVLEHVPDDRKAMQEFFRVLKKDGWAVLLVPIVGELTFEDPSIVDPVERTKIFGQAIITYMICTRCGFPSRSDTASGFLDSGRNNSCGYNKSST